MTQDDPSALTIYFWDGRPSVRSMVRRYDGVNVADDYDQFLRHYSPVDVDHGKCV